MTKKIVHMTTLIGLLLLLFLLPAWTTNQETDVYVIRGQLHWKTLFAEPFETLYIILLDEKCSIIGFTTLEENEVSISVSFLREFLKADGHEISDIIMVVHNHSFGSPFFSWDNGLFLKKLRGEGFKGAFGVYHTPTDSIKWAKEE